MVSFNRTKSFYFRKMKPNAQTGRRHVCVHLTKRTCTQIIVEKTCATTHIKCKKVGLYEKKAVLSSLYTIVEILSYKIQDSILCCILCCFFSEYLVLYLKILFAVSCSVRDTFRRYFLADRTNGRAYATVLRLSSVCDVMYYG